MKMNYPLLIAILAGFSFYASMRWHYWRKRALHTEECLEITQRIRERNEKQLRKLIWPNLEH